MMVSVAADNTSEMQQHLQIGGLIPFQIEIKYLMSFLFVFVYF